MSKNRFFGKYRNETTRMPGWDYTSNATYLITVCTKDRESFFGTIQNGFVCLSDMGSIVSHELQKTPLIRPYVQLDACIVMPNHLHAILHIKHDRRFVGTPRRGVPTDTRTKLKLHHRPEWKPGSLGSIIGQFKIACTKRIHGIGQRQFSWQLRFYEQMIRDEKSLQNARRYVYRNPQQWMHGRDDY